MDTKEAGRKGGKLTAKRGKDYYRDLQKLSTLRKKQRKEILKSFTVGEIQDNPITLQSVQDKLEQVDIGGH